MKTLHALSLLGALSLGYAATQTVGLMYHDPSKSYQGYTLFTGKHAGYSFLMDNNGKEINRWMSSYEPGQSLYLLEDGSIMRAALLKGQYSIGGGEGGRFEMYSWTGDTLWMFDYASNNYMSHHDFAMLPDLADGRKRFLALAVERKTKAESAAAGFDTTLFSEGYISPEYVVEFVQKGKDSYDIAWEWHVWDHLVQNKFADKANYGTPSQNPGKIDVASGTGKQLPAFWNHANSIKYNAKFDQIMISNRGSSEFWVLDHSTTAAEAKSASGGKRGKGGEILYRWGNPAAYGAGSLTADRRLFQQHDAQWIEDGAPGAGNVLIYNNGIDRPGDKFSSVEEVDIPQDTNGNFPAITAGSAHTPKDGIWHYQAPNPTDFYSPEVSGVQRLPNGNTLICEGIPGHFFEITPAGEVVWDYVNPIVTDSILAQGETAEIDPRGHPDNAIFKIHRYAPDYKGLSGRDLTPKNPIERNPWTSTPVQNQNPSVQNFTFHIGENLNLPNLPLMQNAQVRIFNNQGQKLGETQGQGTSLNWNLRLSAGSYHLQIKGPQGYFHSQVQILP